MTLVVIMAGGRGMRLHPLTEKTPKPLLILGSRPIVQTVIEAYVEQGFRDFTLAVHYKARLIEDHFGDGFRFDCRIDYIRETVPLGTAGALRLLPRPTEPFIVAFADVLTKVDYQHLLDFHTSSGAVATACVALYQHQIPFGVARLEGNSIRGVDEKPIENFPVLGGIYVLSPSALDVMTPAGSYDMPDLLTDVLKTPRPGAVAAYPLKGHWEDVGTFESFERNGGKV